MKPGIRFRIGLLLLTINQPLGWGAMAACTALAVRTGRREFYFWGIGAYAASWVMLGLGLLLAGREGTVYIRSSLRKLRNLLLHRFG